MSNSEKSLSELNKRLKDIQSKIKDMKDKQQERSSSLRSKSDDDGEESSSSSPSTRRTKHKHKKKKKKHSRKRKSGGEEEQPASVHAKRKCIPVRIDTSPVRQNHSINRSIGWETDSDNPAPFNEIDLSEPEEIFNARASQTDGYESLNENENQNPVVLVDKEQQNNGELKEPELELDVEKLVSVSTEEERSSPIDEKLAQLIKTNWDSEKPFENMKKIFKTYPCPENCTLDPPKVNGELWKILNSAQRKSDVKLVTIQKSLKKALNVNLKILEEVKNGNVSVQSLAQKTVDMAAILGHASHEISLKRRIFIRGNINPQYKDLCAQSQPITSKLFGDDLPKLVKELNLTNKISNKYAKSSTTKSYDKPQRGQNYNRRNSFLGRGRGSLPYRQNNYTQSKRPKKSN